MARPAHMCAKCSAALAEGAHFCSQCGARTEDGTNAGALEEVREFAMGTAYEAGKQARELMRNETAQKIAGGAALGAAAAVVLPITIGVGAAIGAGIVAYRKLLK